MRKLYPEEIEQIAFVEWLKLKKIEHFAVVNENAMSGINRFMATKIASRSKKMGKRKGVSDTIIMLPKQILFIEMKKCQGIKKDGSKREVNMLEDEQKAFLDKVNTFPYAQGFVAYGCNEAIDIVENQLHTQG